MKISQALAFIFAGISCVPLARAADLQIEQVDGQVLYGAPGNPATIPVIAHTEIQAGTVQTALAGSLFASPGPGSSFHLDHGTQVTFQSNGLAAKSGGGEERDAVVTLSQGRMTASGGPGSGRYDIGTTGGKVSMGAGLCVICMHGDAAHVYVARGSAIIYPHLGPQQNSGVLFLARPTVGILHSNGALETQPLNQVAPAVHNCLLSGAAGGGGGRGAHEGSPNPANIKGNPPVSETE